MDILEKKVKFCNVYLNNLLMMTGSVYSTDIFSVVTRDMLESGKLTIMDGRELALLTRNDTNVEFIKLKRVA
jgi:hypothetical protein